MHFSFPPAKLLSLCLSIALILPTVIGRSIHSPTSPASPLYRRAPSDDPGHVQEQVTDLFSHLSKVKSNKINLRGGKKAKDYEVKLQEHIDYITKNLQKGKGSKGSKDLRILFIEYAGSGGDVGKSMTYPEAIKTRPLYTEGTNFFNKLLTYFRGLKKKANITMKLAVDCNYLKYMTEETRDIWDSDIKLCSVEEDQAKDLVLANQMKFKEVVNDYLTEWKPHIIIQGNAISGLYKPKKAPEDFWSDFHKPMNQMVEDDLIIRANIRADFKQPKEVVTKIEQYPLAKADVVLVGQPADFFKGLPSVNMQTRIGRPQIGGMKAIPPGLKAWLDKSESVMYLGLGGPQRSHELSMETPTECLQKFLKVILEDEEYKDWNFILFHNTIQPKGEEVENPIEDKRVYHIWYGVSLLSIFKHQNVYIAMHHCGRGILDDTIEAGIVPICVGTSDFSDDQFEFAEVVEERKMGRGIVQKADGVFFEGATAKEYTGKQKSFRKEASLVGMFKDVWDKYEDMTPVVEEFKDGVLADTSGGLAFEILFNLKYFQAKRNGKSLK